MSVLEVNHLSVSRGGDSIVEDVSFAVEGGQVTGLIGPNGAGKSTTLGGILGLYPIHNGSITIGDDTFDRKTTLSPDVKGQIAYIPEQPMYYSDLTLREHLHWKQRLWRHYKSNDVQSEMTELIDLFELSPHLGKFPHQCSKGTLQKLMVVSAFMMPFKLLVIDEPFIGLDIVSIRRLKDKIAKAQSDGAAVLVSTHVLDAAEKMCSHFVLLHEGRTVHTGSLVELQKQATEHTGIPGATLEDLFVDLVQQHKVPHAVGGESDCM